MSQPSRRSTPRVADLLGLALVAIAVVAAGLTLASDPDLGFHLATGRAILLSGELPATNVLTFTAPDHPWLLHEGLFGVCVELLRRNGGATALAVAKAATLLLTWGLVYVAARRWGARPLAASIGVLLAALPCAARFAERPHLLTDLFFACVLALLAGPGLGRRYRVACLAAAILVAVNYQLHAGALLTAMLVGAAAAGIWLDGLRQAGHGPAGARAGALLLGALFLAVGVAGLAFQTYHPYGIKLLTVPFRLGSDPYLHAHVAEYRSPFALSLTANAGYWTLLLITLLAAAGRWRTASFRVLLPALFFAALSMRHLRLVDTFAIASAPLVALAVSGLLTDTVRSRAVALLGAITLAVVVPIYNWQLYPPGVGWNPAVWPPLFDTVDELGVEGRAFISDGWAGPWLGRHYPEQRVFFDPRFEAYPDGFAEQVYQAVRYGVEGWDEVLDRHEVEWVLMKYTTETERRNQPNDDNLRQLLVRDPRWQLVAFDDYGLLWVRTRGVNRHVGDRHAIPAIDPDLFGFYGPPGALADTLAAADARLAPSARRSALLAVALFDAGDSQGSMQALLAAEAVDPTHPAIAEAAAFIRAMQGQARP